MSRDDEAFKQKGSVEGGRFLGKYQEADEKKPWKVLPEMKGLKELNVAGPATQVFRYGRTLSTRVKRVSAISFIMS